MKDYSSLINPRNKASNLTSSSGQDAVKEAEEDRRQRGGRTGRLVRFIERRRREAEEEEEVTRVEEVEPRMAGITVHTHYHHGQGLTVRHKETNQFVSLNLIRISAD